MQNCNCLITHSDEKSSSYAINSSDNNDVIIRVSIREEEDSRENIIKKKDKDRKNEKEDRVLSDNLKEAKEEENIISVNKKTHWDNSINDESINWL